MIIRTTTASVYYPIAKRGTNSICGRGRVRSMGAYVLVRRKAEPAMKVPLQAGSSACAFRKQDGGS
jgi:hypothetical protein